MNRPVTLGDGRKRKQVMLSAKDARWLEAYARKLGTSESALLRKAWELYGEWLAANPLRETLDA